MRKLDFVDHACFDWAQVRRTLIGLAEPQKANEYLGAVRCVLGQRRDLHAGSRSEGRLEQHWPEVFQDEAYLVNCAFKRMPEPLKEILDLHYTVERPKSKALRAELAGVPRRLYWARLTRARDFISGYLAAHSSDRA